MRLGKKLVAELGLEPGVDTLSKWMAHYVAELIHKAETATKGEREQRKRECASVIMSLWAHRSSMTDGRRPFESFEPVFRTLKSLDQRTTFRYLLDVPKEENKWLKTAVEIDEAARVAIRLCFAITSWECGERERDWIESYEGIKLKNDQDVVTIRYLLEQREGSKVTPEERRISRLKEGQGRIAALRNACDLIDEVIKASLAYEKTEKASSRARKIGSKTKMKRITTRKGRRRKNPPGRG